MTVCVFDPVQQVMVADRLTVRENSLAGEISKIVQWEDGDTLYTASIAGVTCAVQFVVKGIREMTKTGSWSSEWVELWETNQRLFGDDSLHFQCLLVAYHRPSKTYKVKLFHDSLFPVIYNTEANNLIAIGASELEMAVRVAYHAAVNATQRHTYIRLDNMGVPIKEHYREQVEWGDVWEAVFVNVQGLNRAQFGSLYPDVVRTNDLDGKFSYDRIYAGDV